MEEGFLNVFINNTFIILDLDLFKSIEGALLSVLKMLNGTSGDPLEKKKKLTAYTQQLTIDALKYKGHL